MNEDWCDSQLRDDLCDKAQVVCNQQRPKDTLSAYSEDSCYPAANAADFPSELLTLDSQIEWIHLTEFEINGLKRLVEKLESLPEHKREVPEGLENPLGLLEDMKVRKHIFPSGWQP